jgi:hypothetical protein
MPELLGGVFYLYLDVVCAVAVVASVAEHQAAAGVGGPGAVARALLLAVGWFLPRGGEVGSDDVAFVVDGGVACVLHRAVRMVSTVAVTAYYLECKKSKEIEDKAGCGD